MRVAPTRWLLLLLLVGCAIEPNPSPGTGAYDVLIPSDTGNYPSMDVATGSDAAPVPDVAEPGDVAADDVTGDEDAVAPGDAEVDGDTGGPLVPPDPSGEGPLGSSKATHTIELSPGPLGESLELVVYTPEGDGPHPVVVLLHGSQLGPANYSSYGEHLAQWGFTAVLPRLAGAVELPTHVQLKDAVLEVLDWLESGPLAAKVDLTRLGLAGHSLGGKLSAFVAAVDARPQAIFLIDPVDSKPPLVQDSLGYPSVTPEMMGEIAVPLVSLGETNNGIGGVGVHACAPADDNFERYYEAVQSPALKVDLLKAAHMSFLDDPECGAACLACPPATDDPARTRALTRGLLVAFFKKSLTGEAGWNHWLTGSGLQNAIGDEQITLESKNDF